ncbi:reelin domain-containing protein 1-like [Sycon ciliatum]|uniref:reelin domain-containing protein 1-like n=1 Tax=Sycon ciliatum TaxID=27933 RepID=UPI0031F69261
MSPLRTTILLLACTLVGLLNQAEARSFGAPVEACETMMPMHGGAAAQQGPPPYTVYHNIPNGFNRGTPYRVTVLSTSGAEFLGFFCQVREYGAPAVSRPYGYFTTAPRTQTRDCAARFEDNSINPAAAVTHTERLGVTNISVYWTAPPADVALPATLNVVCSVVQAFSTFWVQIPSTSFYTATNTSILTTGAPAASTAPYTGTVPTTAPYTGTGAPPAATTEFNAGNCPPLATATTDAERYRAYLYCWSQRFEEWYAAYQNWLSSGGQGCAPTTPSS